MSASSKFGEFSDSQLVDWMRSNPGGAAKAFEFWRRSHPEGSVGETVYKDRVVEKVVYQDVEKVVYKDREVEVEVEKVVEKEVINPLNKIAFVIAGCSLIVASTFGVFAGVEVIQVPGPKVETKVEIPGPERVVTETVEVLPDDYKSLKSENDRLRYTLNQSNATVTRLQSVTRYGKPTQSEAYLSLQRENRTLYGILCNRTGFNEYCKRD